MADQQDNDRKEADPLEATIGFDSSSVTFEAIGSTIGPYVLVRKLGAGGFGAVYLAHQRQPIRRDVALKIIKVGMDTEQIIARFQAESQALALMDHPGIAKVHDAGATATGRPYFVMEFVQGDTITRFCDERRLNTEQRLELFIAVCKAIHHAHGKGVIHRDIKPSNILVTEHDGVPAPKVIDFGIAKATQQPLTEQVIHTACHELIGTPKYMSPEQAEGGGNIDERSDIYALGVLLFELLTGHTPFFDDGAADVPYEEFRRLIQEREPAKPSTYISQLADHGSDVAASRATDPQSLRRTLRADLDWIVMKCLEKERCRRYQTAEELADDIRRYSNKEPVLAGPPSVYYRATKFCLRRRSVLIATFLVLGALSLGVIASIVFLYQRRQRERELDQLADVQLLNDLLVEFEGLANVNYVQRRLAMDKWLNRSQGLVERGPSHESALATLRSQAQRTSVSGAGPRNAMSWSFPDPAIQDRHDVLARFIQQLELLQQTAGPLTQVAEWAKKTPTEDEILAAWDGFRKSLPETHPFSTMALPEGLYPLGRDVNSGMWEFVDLTTGLAPDRSTSGLLVVTSRTGIVYVLLDGGEFRMGSPEDEPGRKLDETPHRVTVSPFMVAKFEITQGQWQRVMSENPSQNVGLDLPVERVAWQDCQSFCQRTGSQLPTEAQWEFACRAGEDGPYSGASQLDDVGWYRDNSRMTTHPVGQKAPNRYGLFDLHGNVLEWCRDVYIPEFYSRPEAQLADPCHDDASEVTSGRNSLPPRVLRGGSFEGIPAYCRSADRYKDMPTVRHGGVGFRTVRERP